MNTAPMRPALRRILEDVACLEAGEVAGWAILETPLGPVRIGHEDARRMMEAEDALATMQAIASRVLPPAVAAALANSSGLETLQVMARRAAQEPTPTPQETAP